MFHLDHFAIFSRNFYRTTFELSRSTGLGNFDGGFFPNYGIGIKIIPLGPDLFVEIEGMVDLDILTSRMGTPDAFASMAIARKESFGGWCLRTDTLEELEAFAALRGVEVDHEYLNAENAQQMMNGDKNVVVMAPSAAASWPLGYPNVYFWPDMSKHDSRYPVEKGTGTVEPLGLNWIEVGGTPADFDAWFGGLTKAAEHPIRFNGRELGLYGISVNTNAGERLISLASMTEPL